MAFTSTLWIGATLEDDLPVAAYGAAASYEFFMVSKVWILSATMRCKSIRDKFIGLMASCRCCSSMDKSWSHGVFRARSFDWNALTHSPPNNAGFVSNSP